MQTMPGVEDAFRESLEKADLEKGDEPTAGPRAPPDVMFADINIEDEKEQEFDWDKLWHQDVNLRRLIIELKKPLLIKLDYHQALLELFIVDILANQNKIYPVPVIVIQTTLNGKIKNEDYDVLEQFHFAAYFTENEEKQIEVNIKHLPAKKAVDWIRHFALKHDDDPQDDYPQIVSAYVPWRHSHEVLKVRSMSADFWEISNMENTDPPRYNRLIKIQEEMRRKEAQQKNDEHPLNSEQNISGIIDYETSSNSHQTQQSNEQHGDLSGKKRSHAAMMRKSDDSNDIDES